MVIGGAVGECAEFGVTGPTWDQGDELFQHDRIECESGIRIHFADPHSPWQRPTDPPPVDGVLEMTCPPAAEVRPSRADALIRSLSAAGLDGGRD